MNNNEFLECFMGAIGKGIPDEVEEELKESAKIEYRIRRRLAVNQMLPLDDVRRYNELCYKHFTCIQDLPASLCGVDTTDGTGEAASNG